MNMHREEGHVAEPETREHGVRAGGVHPGPTPVRQFVYLPGLVLISALGRGTPEREVS